MGLGCAGREKETSRGFTATATATGSSGSEGTWSIDESLSELGVCRVSGASERRVAEVNVNGAGLTTAADSAAGVAMAGVAMAVGVAAKASRCGILAVLWTRNSSKS